MGAVRGCLYPVDQFGLGWGKISRRTPEIARMKADGRMNVDEPEFREHDVAASSRSESILERARQAEVDPCIVAEDAMPGYVTGDLNDPESRWVRSHLAGCT